MSPIEVHLDDRRRGIGGDPDGGRRSAEARVPEPALSIRYDELSSLKRHVPRGMGLGKVIGIGLAAGAGAMLTLVAIVASVAD